MKIQFERLKKMESPSLPVLSTKKDDEAVEVIVKVRTPNYLPSDVTVRAQIDPYMFTGVIFANGLLKLDQDPEVIAVTTAKKLRLLERLTVNTAKKKRRHQTEK